VLHCDSALPAWYREEVHALRRRGTGGDIMGASQAHQGCIRVASGMYHRCIRDVLGVQQGCIRGCNRGTSWVLRGSLGVWQQVHCITIGMQVCCGLLLIDPFPIRQKISSYWSETHSSRPRGTLRIGHYLLSGQRYQSWVEPH
jgi:hypothetical protein